MPEAFSHRSTLKQANKSFKSRHASKGSLKAKAKGKAAGEGGSQHSMKQRLSVHKADKRNAAKLLQLKKKEDMMHVHRLFSGPHGVPKIVAVVPLCPDVNAAECVANIFASVDEPIVKQQGSYLLDLKQFKQKMQFIPTERHLLEILDAVKVADLVVFVLSAEEEVDKFGELCMTTIRSQGVPSTLSFVQHLEKDTPKKQLDVRKSLLFYMEHHFSGEHKLFSTGTSPECVKAIRYMTTQRPKTVNWRDRHAYMLADKVEYETVDPISETGTLKVTGYIRGSALSANRLVHIQGLGDFQMEKIMSCPRGEAERMGMNVDSAQILQQADPAAQESLVTENEPDPMDAEQTWPTDEEMGMYQEEMGDSLSEGALSKKTRRVPKGTSSYQAAWIVDDESEGGDDQQEEEYHGEDDFMMDAAQEIPEEEQEASVAGDVSDEEYEEIELEDKETAFDATVNEEHEEEALKEYLDRKKKSQEDMQFPDEVDTPQHTPARVRFQKYRGLKSFRTSLWDPYENLPVDYARIFQFQNFKRSKKRIFDMIGMDGVSLGTYVTVYIKDVPKKVLDMLQPDQLFILFSLLPYERKATTLNFVVTRNNAEYDAPVKSKDPMVFFCGFRRYVVNPIYSTYSRGGSNNVHKFERFLQKGRSSVGSIYAPIQFGPAPIMMFKHSEDGMVWGPENTSHLVGTGSIMDMDPTRITAKRIVITGHPFKVHKRGATIRFMFFSPEDVRYFKPVQLNTKMGRVGHIKESLGTHGYMKCVFDGPLKGQDTICMNLYKRVFPKWNTALYQDDKDEGNKTRMMMD